MREEKYSVSGMSCAACSSAVERVTRKLDGVERADVNLTTGKLVVRYDESKVTPEMIIEKVTKCGFGIEKDSPVCQHGKDDDFFPAPAAHHGYEQSSRKLCADSAPADGSRNDSRQEILHFRLPCAFP